MTKAKVITLGLLALFVLALLCAQRSTRAVATVSSGATESVAKLALSLENGKLVLRGAVPDTTLKQQLVAKAYQVFGAGSVVNYLTVEPDIRSEEWLPKTNDIMTRLKTWGNGAVTLEGTTAIVTGEAKSDAERTKRYDELAAVLGSSAKIDSQIHVKSSSPTGGRATPSNSTSSVVDKIHEVMAGKSIDFEIGSAALAPKGMKLLDVLVPIIQSDKSLRLEIGGHTDNYGDPRFNQMVSQARAVAVAQYLISKGVDSRRLTSKGYGDTKPIASNKTRAGRQQNRRVTFQAL
ncbi:hypothetical protein YTPLAS18_10530 [Nitrospira sp.]|nr:hypothetical protein YTPLAS18_10530 [Nitrospira sp.]